MDLRHRSDCELLSGIVKLVGSHRELTAKLVAHLGEIEDRRLHLHAGFSSMFEFCVKELRMGDGEAFRRILAARLARRFPVIYRRLESGALHLSALELLREHLTGENHAELLEAASGKTKRELEELLAVRFPRPDVPERIRALGRTPRAMNESCHANQTSRSAKAFALEPPVAPTAPEPRPRIEALPSARYRLELTVSSELRDKLELCRDLLSHANPARGLEPVLERAVDLLLTDLERKRLARTKRPARARTPGKGDESNRATSVAAATRREVFERDGLQCTFVSPAGRRCEARALLELDHVEPRGLGGGDDASNLRVRCRAHNQLWAEEAYGREHVERARRNVRCGDPRKRSGPSKGEDYFCWKKLTGDSAGAEAPERDAEMPRTALMASTLEKVRLALRSMGFTDAQSRRAAAEGRGTLGDAATVEEVLRKALLVATRAA